MVYGPRHNLDSYAVTCLVRTTNEVPVLVTYSLEDPEVPSTESSNHLSDTSSVESVVGPSIPKGNPSGLGSCLSK